MKYSYSRVSLFDQCPYHFKLRYLDKYQEVPDYSANSPLILGQALHKGIETNYETMLEDYYKSFPVITDAQINEAIKLEKMLPKVIDFIDNNFKQCELIHEYKIDKPEYIGYVDLIVKDAEGQCLVIDFKYSNNIKNYLDSEQLHIYKYYLEQDGFKIKQLGFLFIEKVNIKQGKSNLYQFRKRLTGKLKSAKVTFIPIEFNKSKVTKFLNSIKQIESTTEYPSNPSGQCFSCAAINNKKASKYTTLTPPDYLNILQNTNGGIEMVLPSVERRDIEKVTKRVMWWYGAPFTGKTTLANEFPNPLMLNTDGNIRFVDAPFVSIADKVEVKGRITETIKAWEILDETILDLEKGDNEFKTIVIDLLEDIYQACRFYEYDKLGIEHESDNSFKAWDIVRNTFLQMMKRIVHLPYENIIFISHEDISKDVTKKTGDKITSITPNLQDKAALKVAGMVDIVGRIVADDDIRKMEFKSKDYVFGGGRLPNLPVTEIDLDVKQIMDVYDQANKGLHKKINASVSNVDEAIKSTLDNQEVIAESEDDTVPPGETIGTVAVEKTEELPKRKRRKRKIEESTDDVIEGTSTRRRRRRGV
ncbi:AAA family ATPase [Melissococcus plutonius]|uniref:AAA family ATPase n=1 Tax=Melissococcus plutonius TaxID=33970 RepID=UPI0021E58E3E|nr:AAA family ATPase [Melissococcus plutonius]MCV2505966.1 AAA family ATPase [Melissococcus plutonius]